MREPIRDAAAAALTQILEPLSELMLDAGITVQEVCRLIRNGSVRNASARIVRKHGRLSKSRVAIMTGLSRAEVNRIIRLGALNAEERRLNRLPARRLLAAWFDDPQFHSPAGKPLSLPIFGKSRSFEHLVRIHGGGVPVRAMLDELLETAAVERLPDQTLRLKSRVPVFKGINVGALDTVGERGRDLLQTLTHNMRCNLPVRVETTAQVADADLDQVAKLRGELMERGHAFIQNAHALLHRSRVKRRGKATRQPPGCRLGVTVYYFQDRIAADEPAAAKPAGRRNLTRRIKV